VTLRFYVAARPLNMMGDGMRRDLEQQLVKWKTGGSHQPLFLLGPRHTGKTYTVRKFAEEHYSDYVEINLEQDAFYRNLFEQTHDPGMIMQQISSRKTDGRISSDALIFIDEIQASPQVLTTLKFMREEWSQDVIVTSSMPETAIAKTSSFPVGSVKTMYMYPMTFLEFLQAYGIERSLIDVLFNAVTTLKPLNEFTHERMNQLFREYILCGGMPAVVKQYVQTGRYSREVLDVQRQIRSDYGNDIARYALGSEKNRVRECYGSIPAQLAKDNHKFQYKLVRKGYGAREYDGSIEWLVNSGLVLKTISVNAVRSPLEAYEDLSSFKLYASDTGVLLASLNDTSVIEFSRSTMSEYQEYIFENAAAEILKAHAKPLYYYAPDQNMEIEFIVPYLGTLAPLEIKSGRHSASASFTRFVKEQKPEYAFRLSMRNLGYDAEQHITYMPLYLLDFLLRVEEQNDPLR
jgi:predicted AAA+ superfamily ATPase